MVFRRYTPCVPALLFALALACGGGGEAPETSSSEPAESVPKEVFQVDPSTAATITGRVVFDGEAPARPRVNMGADEDCKAMHDGPVLSEQTVVNDNGTLRNVYVWVKSGLDD
jgi:hypothetical protein